jgi:hypothetical protein
MACRKSPFGDQNDDREDASPARATPILGKDRSRPSSTDGLCGDRPARWGRDTVLMTLIGSVHSPKKMLSMLVKG